MSTTSEHWDRVYNKAEKEFSWYQSYPGASVRLIQESCVHLNDPIIDVGGGDSHLVDALLQLGYSNLCVLDISVRAIDRAKNRLGTLAERITWVVSDIVSFKPPGKFAVWHDRATFHFLAEDSSITAYRNNISIAMQKGGRFILGTFSADGPEKCSGLPVNRYSESKMEDVFSSTFQKVRCFEELHKTPLETEQLFQFCLFDKR